MRITTEEARSAEEATEDMPLTLLYRWQEALEAGMAPRVALGSTHISALEFCDLEDLKSHAIDDEPAA